MAGLEELEAAALEETNAREEEVKDVDAGPWEELLAGQEVVVWPPPAELARLSGPEEDADAELDPLEGVSWVAGDDGVPDLGVHPTPPPHPTVNPIKHTTPHVGQEVGIPCL